MTTKKSSIFCILSLLVIFFANSVLFTVDETESVVITQFGNPVHEIVEPGLNAKLPFPFQSINRVEKRKFIYDSEPREVITADKKTLVIDTFALCQVIRPTDFIKAVQTVAGAQARIDDIVYSNMRNDIGNTTSDDLVVNKRDELLDRVNEQSSESLSRFAVKSFLTRVNRVELPQENLRSVFERMAAERKQQATKYRSEGGEESLKMTSAADKEATIIIAEAGKKEKTIMGRGDAKAAALYNEFYSKNSDFFRLYYELETARKTLGAESGTKTTFVFRGDEPQFSHLFK